MYRPGAVNRPTVSLLLSVLPVALLALAACEPSHPPRAAQTEMVPSNSAHDTANANAKPRIVGPDAPGGDDGEVPAGGTAPSTGHAGGTGGGGGGPTPVTGSGTGTAGTTTTAQLPAAPAVDPKNQKPPTKAECSAVIDRYVELEVQSNPQLAGIPPEMLKQLLKQAKEQASSQKGDPCAEEKITRAKYNCGMAAQTRDAWKACMK
jgi:hypothetical protein